MRHHRRTKGSSLVFTLVLILLLSIFIFIILSYYRTVFQSDKQYQFSLQAHYNAESAMYIILDSLRTSPDLSLNHYQLKLPWQDEVTVSVRDFGFFKEISTIALKKEQQSSLRFLAGKLLEKEFNYAIHLADTKTALTFAGSAVIKGDIKTGLSGYQTKSFKGKRFSGSIQGETIRNPVNPLPEIDLSQIETQLNSWKKLLKNPVDFQYFKHIAWQKKASNDNIIYSEDDILLTNEFQFLKQENTMFISKQTITISESFAIPHGMTFLADNIIISENVKGTNAIFYAENSITVQNNVRCSGQFFSAQSIRIQDSAHMLYPSVLYVSGLEMLGERRGEIHLLDHSILEGIILYPETTSLLQQEKGYLQIAENSLVNGLVYHAGRVELAGTIYGSLLAMNTYFYDAPTHYINWMRNGTINVFKRKPEFCLPDCFKSSNHYGIVYYENKN